MNISHNPSYTLINSYAERIVNSEEINRIVSFAKTHNLKLISVFCCYDCCDTAIIPDTPLGMLSYATYVTADAFHWSIFSIITELELCTIVRDNNKQKLCSLFSSLCLLDRMFDQSTCLDTMFKNPIDYTQTSIALQEERKRIIEYLRKAIS